MMPIGAFWDSVNDIKDDKLDYNIYYQNQIE